MATHDITRDGPGSAPAGGVDRPNFARRLTTETKSALKTTEFYAFLGVLAAVLIAGAVLDQSDAGGLGGKQVWLYATILTAGYMISRGLAKSGSRDAYDDDSGRH